MNERFNHVCQHFVLQILRLEVSFVKKIFSDRRMGSRAGISMYEMVSGDCTDSAVFAVYTHKR